MSKPESLGVDQEGSIARTEAPASGPRAHPPCCCADCQIVKFIVEIASLDLELATGFDRQVWRDALYNEWQVHHEGFLPAALRDST